MVIVTDSPLDHLSEDSKYFLTLRQAELATSINLIASLVAANRNIDLLHNELSELKVFIESDEETS